MRNLLLSQLSISFILIVLFVLISVNQSEAQPTQAELAYSCDRVSTLRYNEMNDSYDPEPFQYKLLIVNVGDGVALNVTVVLTLPADVKLADSTASLTMLLGNIAPMDSAVLVKTVVWDLVYTGRPTQPSSITLNASINAINEWDNVPLKSIESHCSINVEPVELSSPVVTFYDVNITLNDCEDGYRPDPTQVWIRFTNSSESTLRLKNAIIQFPENEMTLAGSSVAEVALDTVLAKRASLNMNWSFSVRPDVQARTVKIWVLIEDENGGSYSEYLDLDIPPTKQAVSLCNGADSIRPVYDEMLGEFVPNPFPLTMVVRVTGYTLTGCSLILEITGEAAEYVSISGMDTIQVLADIQSCDRFTIQWQLKITKKNETGRKIIGRIRYTLIADGNKVFHDSCQYIVLDSVKPVGVEHNPQPSSFTMSVYPNPLREQTTLSFNIPERNAVTLQVYDMMGRRVKDEMLGNYAPGSHTLALDMTMLPAGTYICRLRAGTAWRSTMITVRR
jgi:type IX secretion system substrate protein